MKKTIQSILTFALILLTSNLVFSQSVETEDAKKILNLRTVLSLTPEQQAQIKKIRDENKATRVELKSKLKDARANGAVTEIKKPLHDQLSVIREENRGKIKQILTPEQLVKYEQLIQSREQVRNQKIEERKQLKKSQSTTIN